MINFIVNMEFKDSYVKSFKLDKNNYYYKEEQKKLLKDIDDYLYKLLRRRYDDTLDCEDIQCIAQAIIDCSNEGNIYNIVNKVDDVTLISFNAILTNDYQGNYMLFFEIYEGEINPPVIKTG